MIWLKCLGNAACISTVVVFSPGVSQALDSADCGVIEEQAMTLLDFNAGLEVTQSPTSIAQALPDGCMTTLVEIYAEDLGLVFRAERVTFTGTELLEWARGAVVLPETLSVEIDGLYLTDTIPTTPDQAWIRDLMGPEAPVQVVVTSRWDEATQSLNVGGARVVFDASNLVTLSLVGQAAEWRPFEMSDQSFATSRARVEIAFDGLFEQAVVAPLNAQGIDMSATSMAFVAAATEALAATAPAAFLPPSEAAEITAFAQTLPNPRGVLSLSLDTTTPVVISRSFEALRSGIPFGTAVPTGVSIGVQWTPVN